MVTNEHLTAQEIIDMSEKEIKELEEERIKKINAGYR